jgi:predicted 3-demethylubiquinone-9 3-methyltransferase (glyoxalase superfamily)
MPETATPRTAGRGPRITPYLWFAHQAEEAAAHYTSIFPRSRIVDVTRYMGEAAPAGGPRRGDVLTVAFELDGQPFVALNGGLAFQFTEAVSFMVACADQAEVDHYWERLGEGGDPAAQQCGWLKDRYGVSWQVVPARLHELLADPDPARAGRATAALLTMKKLDIAELERAADG